MSEARGPVGSTREGIHWTRLGLMLHRDDLLESEVEAIKWARERFVRLLVDRRVLASVAREAFYIHVNSGTGSGLIEAAVEGDEEAAARARELLRTLVGAGFSYREACKAMGVEVPSPPGEEITLDRSDLVADPPEEIVGADEVEIPESPITLLPGCDFSHRLREDEVEFLGIEEDFEGADVLTFRCPLCKQVHKSRRYG